MREKEKKLILTFHTTSAAIATEKFCKKNDLPGRLIPVPRSITSDCGMAWCAPCDQRDAILNCPDLPEVAGVYEVML